MNKARRGAGPVGGVCERVCPKVPGLAPGPLIWDQPVMAVTFTFVYRWRWPVRRREPFLAWKYWM